MSISLVIFTIGKLLSTTFPGMNRVYTNPTLNLYQKTPPKKKVRFWFRKKLIGMVSEVLVLTSNLSI